MRQFRARWEIAVLLMLILAVSGCNRLGFGYKRIGDIQKSPEQFEGKEVAIRGTVMDVVKLPFVESKIYSINDGSGQMIVLTKGLPPAKGDEVSVKGRASSVAILSGRSLGLHIEETQRR